MYHSLSHYYDKPRIFTAKQFFTNSVQRYLALFCYANLKKELQVLRTRATRRDSRYILISVSLEEEREKGKKEREENMRSLGGGGSSERSRDSH